MLLLLVLGLGFCFVLVFFFSERDTSDEVVGSGLLPATSEEEKKNIYGGLIIKQKGSGTEERNSLIRLFNR